MNSNPCRFLWCALLALSVTACGGDSEEGETVRQPSPQAEAPPSGAVTAQASCSLPDFQASVMERVNEARAQRQLCGSNAFPAAPPLAWDDRLFQAAADHAADMAQNDYFSHESRDGRTFSQRITEAGYEWSAAGENIAAGQADVEQVVQAWLDSPGHCANIMSESFTEIGVACVADPDSTYTQYWGMSLARPR